MRYYIIAGEASGDLHGASLVRALSLIDREAQFRGWGGDKMAAAGVALVKHYRETAFMGFWEVFLNIRSILENIRLCQQDIEKYQPDAVILIDYPGFNLRIARWAKTHGFKVLYYIAPQLWAWHTSRVKILRDYTDQLYVILPFEPGFFQRFNVTAEYYGHPLVDIIDAFEPDRAFLENHSIDAGQPLIALLPGSRQQEIKRTLPVMVEASRFFPAYQFILAATGDYDDDFYRQLTGGMDRVKIIRNETYNLLAHATGAVVTSGTATLETALFNVPQVIVYKGNPISYFIGKRLVKVSSIGLPNLIYGQKFLEELIQTSFTVSRLQTAIEGIMLKERQDEIRSIYQQLREKLGGGGVAGKIARSMYLYLIN